MNKTITLVERAFALPDSKEEFGMKIADHKLICQILDAHLDVTQEKINESNNEFRDKLISDVVEVMGNELRPFKEANEKAHKDLAAQIQKIDNRTNDKRVWTIRVLVAVVTILLAVVFAFVLFIGYHNKYLTTGNKFRFFNSNYFETNLRDAQTKWTNTIRGSADAKNWTAAQRDSIIEENQKGTLKRIERNSKK